MNKPLRRIAIFCGLLVLALLVRDNWLQYVKADSLKNDKLNRRVTIARYSTPRGDIIVDGDPITGSTTTSTSGLNDLKYKRGSGRTGRASARRGRWTHRGRRPPRT